mgnify:CR=1 FL=1
MAGNSLIDLVDDLNKIKLSYDVLGSFLGSSDAYYDSHSLAQLMSLLNDRLDGEVNKLSSIIHSDKVG